MFGHEMLSASHRNPEGLRDRIRNVDRAGVGHEPGVDIEVCDEFEHLACVHFCFEEGSCGQQGSKSLQVARLGQVPREVREYEPIEQALLDVFPEQRCNRPMARNGVQPISGAGLQEQPVSK